MLCWKTRVRAEPGSCPICGMALEPRTITAIEEENPELRDMTRRFWVAVALTLPLLAIAMADMLQGMPVQRVLGAGRFPWIRCDIECASWWRPNLCEPPRVGQTRR